eukprot:4621257-Pyramimonas_sp.AAC.1
MRSAGGSLPPACSSPPLPSPAPRPRRGRSSSPRPPSGRSGGAGSAGHLFLRNHSASAASRTPWHDCNDNAHLIVIYAPAQRCRGYMCGAEEATAQTNCFWNRRKAASRVVGTGLQCSMT